MRKNEKNRLLKAQIQEELNAEADNLLDEVDVERIENLVKKLNTYDKVKPDLSDYDRFLYEFNSKNGVKLQSSSKDKKLRLCNNRRTAFKISSKLASAAVIVFAFFISNTAVKADASDSISSWLSEVKNSVVFAFSDESYKEWVLDNEKYEPKYELGNNVGDYFVDKDAFEPIKDVIRVLDYDDIEWTGIMKPHYIPEGYNVGEVDMLSCDSYLDRFEIFYAGPGSEYVNISVEHWSQENYIKNNISFNTVYSGTLKLNDFVAYIFTGENLSETFFWKDGKIYNISTTLNKESLQKILENMSYENS